MTQQATVFGWSRRSIKHPSGLGSIGQFTLTCNHCGESILRGAPYNVPGERYFTLMAKRMAKEHLAEEHPEILALTEGKEQS